MKWAILLVAAYFSHNCLFYVNAHQSSQSIKVPASDLLTGDEALIMDSGVFKHSTLTSTHERTADGILTPKGESFAQNESEASFSHETRGYEALYTGIFGKDQEKTPTPNLERANRKPNCIMGKNRISSKDARPEYVSPDSRSAFTPAHLRSLARRTEALFTHGWNAYIKFGFPADEVRPLTCEPYGPSATFDWRNDAMGNVSLTMLDNIDTLILLKKYDELENVLNYLRSRKTTLFAQDTTVQMFEAAIRWLGGLLLAHMLMSEVQWRAPRMACIARTYDGFLLHMAHDLGLRLLPAYDTATRLPVARVNLNGAPVPPTLNSETCTAGVGTPFVEMTLLLRLTGDERFERHATRAFWALWRGRLAAGLIPLSLDPHYGTWLNTDTGVGALIDSFYEHALKGSIIFSDENLWQVFARSYESLLTHLARPVAGAGTIFPNTNTNLGSLAATWIDLLGAFWPGLQVLAGRLTDAVATHTVYLKIWNTFDLIPERWNFIRGQDMDPVHASVSLEWYPLRPEFIESTYYLYRATHDPLYLEIGSHILLLFETRFKAPCGFAGVQDIRTGKRLNRMETFVLGELLKYLYLLFDESNILHQNMSLKNWVMSTEAHPFWYTETIGIKHRRQFQAQIADVIVMLDSKDYISRMKKLWNMLSGGLVRVSNSVEPPSATPVLPFGQGIPPLCDRLEVCEVQPRQFEKSDSRFRLSAYASWAEFFAPDAYFVETLVRPPHLGQQNTIELSALFLETYGLGAPLQCNRIPTSTEQDVVLGKLQRPEEYQMYSVRTRNEKHPFLERDHIMPELSGRMRMECVSEGMVDSSNRLILRADVLRWRPEKKVSRQAEVCRACMINGAHIDRNSTLWTAREYAKKYLGVFQITSAGVFVHDKYVENLRVY